jgi:hypothetical protein
MPMLETCGGFVLFRLNWFLSLLKEIRDMKKAFSRVWTRAKGISYASELPLSTGTSCLSPSVQT